ASAAPIVHSPHCDARPCPRGDLPVAFPESRTDGAPGAVCGNHGREMTGARVARSRLGYSPALDGVRGLFMLCFMAFHFGATWLSGAWVGINLFFVLSAFLITRLLVEEKMVHGDIDAIAFYKRRARRLLPGLFLVLGFIVTYA